MPSWNYLLEFTLLSLGMDCTVLFLVCFYFTDSHTDQQLKMDLHRLSEETKISEARRDNIKSEASGQFE